MTRLTCLLLLPLALLCTASQAQDRLAPVAPFLDEQTFAIGRLNVEQLDVPEIMKLLGSLIPPGDSELKNTQRELAEATRKGQQMRQKFLDAGAREIYAVVSIADLPANPPFLVVPLKAGAEHQPLADILQKATRLQSSHRFEGSLVVGSAATIERLQKLKPVERPDLAKALAAAGDTTLQIVFSPSQDTRRVLREMVPRLPEPVGGSGATLADGLQWAAISVGTPPQLSLAINIQSKDAESAAALNKLITRSLALVRENEAARGDVPELDKVLDLFAPTVQDDRLMLAINADGGTQLVLAALAKPLQAARIAAGRQTSMNHLKQLALAMHNYLDAKYLFPPRASAAKDGKALLSWRVHLLPYLEQKALYEQFHLDEPWDSEHNLKLVEKMPAIFASPQLSHEQIAQGLTTYVGPYTTAPRAPAKKGEVGEQTIFDVTEGAPITKITDGTSNTVMILEANPKHAVVWTKHADVEIDFKNPLAALQGQPSHGFNAAFGDGSVRFISDNVDPKLLRRLLLMNDGEVVGAF